MKPLKASRVKSQPIPKQPSDKEERHSEERALGKTIGLGIEVTVCKEGRKLLMFSSQKQNRKGWRDE